MVPDPPKNDPGSCNLETEDDVAMGVIETDSDDGADQPDEYHGYTMLPADMNQMPEDNADDSTEPEDEDNESIITAHSDGSTIEAVSKFDSATAREVAAVWNAPRGPRDTDQPLDSEQAAKVLKAMEGFTLPMSATPSWARGISDQEFKKVLLEKLPSKGSDAT